MEATPRPRQVHGGVPRSDSDRQFGLVDHLRQRDSTLEGLLRSRRVVCPPFVVGEIAVGLIKDREVVLDSLQLLPQIVVAHDDEVLKLISHRQLFWIGIGYADAYLLATVRLAPGTLLWTRDKRLRRAAAALQVAFDVAS